MDGVDVWPWGAAELSDVLGRMDEDVLAEGSPELVKVLGRALRGVVKASHAGRF